MHSCSRSSAATPASVEIFPTGEVRYTGVGDVKTVGELRWTITPAKIAALHSLFREHGFARMNREYLEQHRSDGEMVVTSYRGRTVALDDGDMTAPYVELGAIQRGIDDIVEIERAIGTRVNTIIDRCEANPLSAECM